MGVETYLARRYLLDRRHGAWGWLISWMAIGSVALGVAVLIVTLSVMTGFREDIREKLLGVEPHLIVSSPSNQFSLQDPDLAAVLSADSDVKASAPYVMGQVLLGRAAHSSGSLIKGIDPAQELKVVDLNKMLVNGEWSVFHQNDPSQKPPIFLGHELARILGARRGDIVWAIAPGAEGMSALSMPKANLFTVQGFIKSGRYDYDSSLAYIPLKSAQTIFRMGDNVSGIGVRLGDPESAVRKAKELQIRFAGEYWVRSWLSLNQNLFNALKLEKTVMFIIFSLVTLVASFMIVSNLLLTITQKIKEIGILRAMGATSGHIRRTFLLQGLFMGLVGNAIGVAAGLALSLLLKTTNFIQLPADVYYIDRLPIRIDGMDILSVAVAASLIVLVASLYPAHRASKLDPLDAIRYG